MMWISLSMLVMCVVLVGAPSGAVTCPPDSVPAGAVCIDKYEASVWNVPNPTTSNGGLVTKIKNGAATLADLQAGGATQVGCIGSSSNPFPANFPANGNWTSTSTPPTPGVYAVSLAEVIPSSCITWFQSIQACLLSDKHLLTNAEWQTAAAGTPDPGNADDLATTCATGTSTGVATGSRSSCRSSWGAFDMVGNVEEWVADWVPQSTACPGWGPFPEYGNDSMCLAGASTTATAPGALVRGGSRSGGNSAGVFHVSGELAPQDSFASVGFRCAR